MSKFSAHYSLWILRPMYYFIPVLYRNYSFAIFSLCSSVVALTLHHLCESVMSQNGCWALHTLKYFILVDCLVLWAKERHVCLEQGHYKMGQEKHCSSLFAPSSIESSVVGTVPATLQSKSCKSTFHCSATTVCVWVRVCSAQVPVPLCDGPNLPPGCQPLAPPCSGSSSPWTDWQPSPPAGARRVQCWGRGHTHRSTLVGRR